MNDRTLQQIGSMRGMTPAVKFLIFLNVAIFYLEMFFGWPLREAFSLRADWFHRLAFTELFTYMFVHFNFTHLLMNMLTLFFIGPVVERTIGTYRFFMLYYLSGILGGLGWSLLAPEYTSCLGASGAVMGVIGAFGALYPNSTLLLWFVLPVKTWVLIIGLILWELHETISSPAIGGIANAAHLVGCIVGFSYAFSLAGGRKGFLERFRGFHVSRRVTAPRHGAGSTTASGMDPAELDRILEKISREGMGSLTPQERERLRRAARS